MYIPAQSHFLSGLMFVKHVEWIGFALIKTGGRRRTWKPKNRIYHQDGRKTSQKKIKLPKTWVHVGTTALDFRDRSMRKVSALVVLDEEWLTNKNNTFCKSLCKTVMNQHYVAWSVYNSFTLSFLRFMIL